MRLLTDTRSWLNQQKVLCWTAKPDKLFTWCYGVRFSREKL